MNDVYFLLPQTLQRQINIMTFKLVTQQLLDVKIAFENDVFPHGRVILKSDGVTTLEQYEITTFMSKD